MNKRVKELYDQALVAAGKEKKFNATNLDVAEKFAWLIVRECAGIYECIDNGNDWGGTEDYLEALDQTFRS